MTEDSGRKPTETADSVLESAASGIALWHLAGNPDFPVPFAPNSGIPHGRILAQVGRRVLSRYGHRLDAHYVEMLHRLFNQCESLHFPLSVRKDPFAGFREESVIVRAFFEGHTAATGGSGLVEHRDALRFWLLAALDQLKSSDEPDKPAFLKWLALAPERMDSGAQLPAAVSQALGSPRMIAPSDAEHWFKALRLPARYRRLAVGTLCAESPRTSPSVLRSRLPQPPRARVRRRPISPSPTIQHTHSDEIPEEDVVDVAVEIELASVDPLDAELDEVARPPAEPTVDLQSRKLHAWAKQDARLRIVDGLLPHTERVLTEREARDFYSLVARQVAPASGPPDRSQLLVIDVMLLLMLVTARDYVSILCALHHHLTGSTDSEGLNLRIAEDVWFSLPDHPLPDLTPVDSIFHAPHQRHIELALPIAVKAGIRHLRTYGLDPMACDRDEILFRMQEYKQTIPRLTLGRLRNTLPVLLYTVTGHPRTIQLIAGTDGFRSPAPLHYYAPRHETISGHYASALRLAGIQIGPRMLGRTLRVGAPRAALEIGPVADAIGRLANRVRELERSAQGMQRTVDLYNAVALYTALMFAAYGADRFSSSLSELTLRQFVVFPSGSGIAVFDDKRSDGSTMRLAAMPTEFFEQLNYLCFVARRTLRYARERLGTNHPVTHAVEGSLNGSAPVWFWLDWPNKVVEPVTRDRLQRVCVGLNVSVVLLRHLFATTAEELRMPSGDIAQQMGHRVDHTPYSKLDLDSPRQFSERLAPFLSAYGQALHLAVVSTRRGQEHVCLSEIPAFSVPELLRTVSRRKTPRRRAEQNDRVQQADDEGLKVFDESGSVWIRLLESESRIVQTHLEAYRTIFALETCLHDLLRDGWSSQAVKESGNDPCATAQRCAARLLVCIWGLTTDPARLRDIELHASLFRVETSPWAVLWSPTDDARIGIQLVSAELAPLVRRLCESRNPLEPTDTLEDLKAADRRISRILGDAVFEEILKIIAAARQLTVAGHRAAWERGALLSTGPRADRFLTAILNKPVAPLPRTGVQGLVCAATESRQPGDDSVTGYQAVRRALGEYKNNPTPSHRNVLSDEIRNLLPKTVPGSLPRLLLAAIQQEIKAPELKLSSLYAYVTRLSPVVVSSLEASAESADPDFIETLLEGHLMKGRLPAESRSASHDRHHALSWLIRCNSPEDIVFDISEVLDGTDAFVQPPRAGDPISQTEVNAFLTQLLKIEYVDSALDGKSVERIAWIIELAAFIQSSHGLRLREVWGLSTTDIAISRDRCEIFVRPRRPFGLKGPASKRIVSRALDDQAYHVFRRLLERIHPAIIDQPASVELLALTCAEKYPEWSRIFYTAFNAARSMSFKDHAVFRPHGHRHSYATGLAMKMQLEQFGQLVLDLPGDLPGVVSRLPRRVQYRYISRQLGHGDPETTLRYYDHSIPLMLSTLEGWRGADANFLAAVLGIPDDTFKKRLQRQAGPRPLDAVVLHALSLCDLVARFGVFDSPVAERLELPSPGLPPRTLEFVARVAIRLRSGTSAEAVAAEFDIRVESARVLHEKLVDADQILRVEFFNNSKGHLMNPALRMGQFADQLAVLEQALRSQGSWCKKLFELHSAFMCSVESGRSVWEAMVQSAGPGASGLRRLGSKRRALLRISILVFCREFCMNE